MTKNVEVLEMYFLPNALGYLNSISENVAVIYALQEIFLQGGLCIIRVKQVRLEASLLSQLWFYHNCLDSCLNFFTTAYSWFSIISILSESIKT